MFIIGFVMMIIGSWVLGSVIEKKNKFRGVVGLIIVMIGGLIAGSHL